MNDLTKPERIQLEELETVISNGIQTFAEVGNALLAIREAKLYRAEHGTFEAYCLKRWGFTRMRACQLIGAAAVVENVNNCLQKPATESQARPLTKLPASEQPAAWQAATDKAQSEGRNVLARDVEEAVEEKRAKEEAAKPQTANKNTKPCDGLQFARMAILDLKQIKKNDTERKDAFNMVKEWINENE